MRPRSILPKPVPPMPTAMSRVSSRAASSSWSRSGCDMQSISVRAGKGLGDSIYLQSVARHFIAAGHRVEACSDWPDVFAPLGESCTVVPFRRLNTDRIAHYTAGKHNANTDQWQDCCRRAGITESVELRLDWEPRTACFSREVSDKPLIIVLVPREPMDRKDHYARELLPDCAVLQRAIDLLRPQAHIVQVGAGVPLHRLNGLDVDLVNRTSVSDLLDVAASADAVLGYVSFLIPLAEALGKPGLMVWSRRGLGSAEEYIRTITPKKIIHRKDLLRVVIDDCSDAELAEACHTLLGEIRRSPVV